MVGVRDVGRAALSAGLVLSLGRWPLHWRHDPWLAALSAVVILGLVIGLWSSRGTAALRATAAICLIDAIVVIRAWSARLPLHCGCVRRRGAPALAGWGGAIIAIDVLVAAAAVWLSRPPSRKLQRS